MEQVRRLLKLSTEGYEKLVFKHYFHWCELHAKKILGKDGSQDVDINDFQKLLANSSLFNYWQEEFRIYELDFVRAGQVYTKPDPEGMKKLYERFVWQVKSHFSKTLLESARKMNLNPQLN